MLKCPVCSYIIEKGSTEGMIGQKVVCTSCLSEFIVTEEMIRGKSSRRQTQSYVTPTESSIRDLAHKQTDGVGTYRLHGNNIKHSKEDIFGNIARNAVIQDMQPESAAKHDQSVPISKPEPKDIQPVDNSDDDLPMNGNEPPIVTQPAQSIEPEELAGSGFADSLFSSDSRETKNADLSGLEAETTDLPTDFGNEVQQDASFGGQKDDLMDGLDLELPDDFLSDGLTELKPSDSDDELGGLEQAMKEGSDEASLDIPSDFAEEKPSLGSGLSIDGLDLDFSEGPSTNFEDAPSPVPENNDILNLDTEQDSFNNNTGNIDVSSGSLDIDMPPPPPNAPRPPHSQEAENPSSAATSQKGHTTVPRVNVRPMQRDILKFIFMGLMLLVFIGVILGQTRYGYFGVKAIFDIKPVSGSSKTSIVEPKSSRALDLIDSFQTFKSRLRFFMVNPSVLEKANNATKKKVLALLTGFQVRYPKSYKNETAFQAIFTKLKAQLHPSGKNWDAFLIEKDIVAGKLKTAKIRLDKVAPTLGDSAIKHYLYGRLAFAKKNYMEAEKQLQIALLKQKKLTKASYFLGLTYLKEKSYDNAFSAFKNVIAEEKGHLGAHLGYAWAIFGKSGIAKAEAIGKKYTQRARSLKDIDDEYFGHLLMARLYGSSGARKKEIFHLQRIITIQPNNKWAGLRLARYWIAEGQVEDAWNVLSVAKQKGIKSKELYTLMLKTVFIMGKEGSARKIFREAVKLYPKSPVFYILKGKFYWKKGLVTTAAESFSKAVALDPSNPDVYVALGKVLLQQHRYKDAVNNLKHGIAKASVSAPILEELSRVYLAMGLFQKAESTLDQVLQKQPGRISALKLLGRVFFELSSYSSAIRTYEVLKRKGALDKETSIIYAKALVMAGRYDDASEVLTQWYELDKDDFVVGVEMSRIYTKQGKLKQAEVLLEHFKKINSQYAPLYSAYGLLYAARKEYAKAADMYLRATTLDSTDYSGRFRMAQNLWKTGGMGNTKLAINQLNIVIQAYKAGVVPRQKRNAGVYVLRGRIYFKLQKYQSALTNFDNALELAPDRIDILLQAGESLFNMAHYTEAAQYFRRVLGKDAQEPTANYYLGIISIRSNDTRNATRYFSTTIMRAGDLYPNAYRMLGMIYRDQGNDRLAISQFKLYLKLAPPKDPRRPEVQRLISDYYMKR